MLTKGQYKFLCRIKRYPEWPLQKLLPPKDRKDKYRVKWDIYKELEKGKFVQPSGGDYLHYPIRITQTGIQAMEEYEAANRAEARDEKAIKTAKRANLLSVLALILSAAALLLQFFPS